MAPGRRRCRRAATRCARRPWPTWSRPMPGSRPAEESRNGDYLRPNVWLATPRGVTATRKEPGDYEAVAVAGGAGRPDRWRGPDPGRQLRPSAGPRPARPPEDHLRPLRPVGPER